MLSDDAEMLEAAAVLHDIGYSPSIATTGFHPLDGARFLRDQEGADERVTRLVAHHSCALLEAEERGLRQELETEFALERPELVDALIVSDMTTTPDGEATTSTARVAEIVQRYGPDTVVGRFIQRAAPEIHAAVARVDRRMAAAGSSHPM
ncbi:phosphohydrolase [Streptomyces sp. FR-008]|nr:phosphohydrolase [Streptomyces sp. FR-008]